MRGSDRGDVSSSTSKSDKCIVNSLRVVRTRVKDHGSRKRNVKMTCFNGLVLSECQPSSAVEKAFLADFESLLIILTGTENIAHGLKRTCMVYHNTQCRLFLFPRTL